MSGRNTRQNTSIIQMVQDSGLSPSKTHDNREMHDGDVVKEMCELRGLMMDIKKSIETQESTLNTKIDQISVNLGNSIQALGTQLKESFSQQLGDLQTYVDQEVGRMVSRIQGAENRLDNIETKLDPGDFDPEVTVVARGVPQEANENIQEKATDIVRRGLNIQDIPVVKAHRLETKGRRPGLVKMQFRNLEEKKTILRVKFDLNAEGNMYKGVTMRTAFSHLERVHQDNIRQILRMVPDGDQFYFTGSGKLAKKTDRAARNDIHGIRNQDQAGADVTDHTQN